MQPSSRYSNIDETSEKKEGEPSPIADNQVILYQGRSVRSTLTVVPSLFDRLMMASSAIFEVQPENMMARLPKGLLKMMGQLDNMLNQTQNPSKEEKGFFSLSMEQEIAEEEKREQKKGLIENAFEGIIHELGTQREQQLKLAKVSTMKEFLAKQEKVRGYQLEAENRYLENPLNVERRKEIDRQMVMAYKEGVQTTKDAAIIENYWNYVTKDPQGQVQRREIESRASDLFLKSIDGLMDEMTDKMEQVMKEGQKMKPAQFMADYVHGMAQKTSQKLMEERAACQTDEEKLVIDYLLLTGGCQMSAFLNHQLRTVLQSQLEKAKSEAEIWMDYERGLSRDLIEYYEEATESSKKNIANCKERYASSNSQIMRKSYLAQIEISEEGIKEYEKIIEKEKQKTEKDLREQAYKHLDENPREIRALIPKETHFETLMLEMLNLEAGMQVSLESPTALMATPDLQLDLNQLSNPVDYFYQQIEMKDQKKLQLFQG